MADFRNNEDYPMHMEIGWRVALAEIVLPMCDDILVNSILHLRCRLPIRQAYCRQ